MKKRFLAVTVLGLACMAAQADVGLSAEVSTAGGGLHLVLPIVPKHLNSRLGLNVASYTYNGVESGIEYEIKAKLNTWDVLLDYYPFFGAFRLTGGAIYNGNKLTANGKPGANATYNINGVDYQASQIGTLQGNIEFKKVAPYLGIGWGNAVAKDKGFGFTSDFGVMFQGAARTSLTNSYCTAATDVCAQLQTDLAAENQELSDSLKGWRAYPVIRLGLSYRF